MENNMVSLNISNDMLSPVIEGHVKAMMTEALGGKDAIIDKIISQVLKTRVGSDGKPSTYSNNKTYFEWLLKDELTKSVKELISEEVRLKAGNIKTAIKKQMKSEVGASKIADALINGLSDTLQNSWSSEFNIEIYPKKD